MVGNLLAKDKPVCRETPKTKLPQWLLESEYYADPPQGEEGYTGVAGFLPAGGEDLRAGAQAARRRRRPGAAVVSARSEGEAARTRPVMMAWRVVRTHSFYESRY